MRVRVRPDSTDSKVNLSLFVDGGKIVEMVQEDDVTPFVGRETGGLKEELALEMEEKVVTRPRSGLEPSERRENVTVKPREDYFEENEESEDVLAERARERANFDDGGAPKPVKGEAVVAVRDRRGRVRGREEEDVVKMGAAKSASSSGGTILRPFWITDSLSPFWLTFKS